MEPKSLSERPARIGCIHATLGSAAPLGAALGQVMPEAKVLHFVNEDLLAYVNQRGGVDEKAMRMFAQQVFHAEEAGCDLIIIACNVFAPRADEVRPFLTAPLLTVDSAMQERAAALGGRIGVMGTNRSAVPACCKGILKAAHSAGLPEPVFTDATILEAADLLSRGDVQAFDQLLAGKARQLAEEGCTSIVLSQVTMARAKKAIVEADIHVPILTSPEECALRARSLLWEA